MIIYENSIEQFNDDVMQNCIADRATEKYLKYYNRKPGDSEYRAWAISLAILNNSFLYAGLKNNHVIVEYELPYTSQRIDVLVFGNDLKGEGNIVMLELKQWSNNKVYDSPNEGNIVVDYGRFREERPHPSLQVQGYYFHLKDFLRIFEDKNAPKLSPGVYVHNYSKIGDTLLFSHKFADVIKSFPLFAKEDSIELAKFLTERLKGGNGRILYDRFANSAIGPSKKLLDHTSEMINKRQIFNLIDEQITTYNAIKHKVKQISKTKGKSVVIIKGGPGTGKSVIALEVMAELMRQGKIVFHATGSSAFTKTLRKIVGRRACNLFKFFFSFTKYKDNEIDVLICDEAHRLRANSNDYGVPWELRSRNPQVEDLIRPAKLTIFFIDEFQVVRPKEIGSVSLIKNAAHKLGINDTEILEFELKTQFRCSGSDAYLQWLDRVLGIRDSDFKTFDKKMEFKIFNTPQKLKEAIYQKNKENPNSARIVAGFCWPWSNPNPDGSLVNDVRIGDFEMPWENKKEFWKFATDKSGMEQVGTVYTAQGFEFDYIGVIFGNDLIWDSDSNNWMAKLENSHDQMVTRNNTNLVDHLKHVYRVLMSRAHRGVYVYFMDKETEEYFRSNMKI